MNRIKPVPEWPPAARWLIALPITVVIVVPLLLACLAFEVLYAASKAIVESDVLVLIPACFLAVVFGSSRSRQ